MTDKECQQMIGAILGGLVMSTQDMEQVERAFQWWIENQKVGFEYMQKLLDSQQ